MTVGETIRMVRKAHGITQKQLGASMGIDDATVRKYESGRLKPSLSTLQKFADALCVDISVLTEGELNASKAMLKLFSIFRTYSGEIKDGSMLMQEMQSGTFNEDQIYLSFKSLNSLLFSWLQKYEQYKKAIESASFYSDPDFRQQCIDKAENEFFMYMFNYPESEPQQNELNKISHLDEANDFIGSNPLNDPEIPLSEEEKKVAVSQANALFAKIKDIQQ